MPIIYGPKSTITTPLNNNKECEETHQNYHYQTHIFSSHGVALYFSHIDTRIQRIR